MMQVLDDFAAKVPSHLWPNTEESMVPYMELPATLARWQNPREADALTRVQEEVEETKIILVSCVCVCSEAHTLCNGLKWVKFLRAIFWQ